MPPSAAAPDADRDRHHEARHAAGLLAGKNKVLQRILVPAYHRLRGYRTLHYEFTPHS